MIRETKVILFLIVILNSCAQFDSSHKNDSDKLIHKLDSMNNKLDSIMTSSPFMFDKALTLEKLNSDSALSIYNQISENDTSSFWALLSNERHAELNSNVGKSFIKGLFEFGLNDTLILLYNDSKCGEWGGDQERIKVYLKREFEKGESYLSADYTKKIYDCDDLEAYDVIKYKSIEKRNIIIKPSDEKIIENCIIALVKQKMEGQFLGHAGKTSSVNLVIANRENELYIKDYSWFSWKEFHHLKRILLTR